jgi:hypothetical protein
MAVFVNFLVIKIRVSRRNLMSVIEKNKTLKIKKEQK